MDNTSLINIAKSEGLEENKVQSLLGSFTQSFQEAKELASGAKSIKVTGEDQVEEMTKARELRLSLKATRVDVEKTRKELKEQSLREGKAIDGMANIIKALIIPVEEYLEDQEKFAERQRDLRNQEVEQKRIAELSKYVDEVEVHKLHPNYMSADTFNKLLETSEKAWKAQREAEKRAEEDRIAKEKADAEERERIRLENEKLKKEREEREAEIAKEKAEQDKKMEAERREKERLEAELEAKKKEEIKAKREAEEKERKEREAEEERRRQQMTAPDKEKLYKLADDIESNLKLPSFSSTEAQDIGHNALTKMNEVIAYIRNSAESLGKNQ
jgi:hypothetical protein